MDQIRFSILNNNYSLLSELNGIFVRRLSFDAGPN